MDIIGVLQSLLVKHDPNSTYVFNDDFLTMGRNKITYYHGGYWIEIAISTGSYTFIKDNIPIGSGSVDL